MKKALIWVAVLLGALSSGCSGGGGSGVPSTLPQNLQSAPAPAEPFTVPMTDLRASSGMYSYTARYYQTPNTGTTLFNGQLANSSNVFLEVFRNNRLHGYDSSTAFYLENPYTPVGFVGAVPSTRFIFNSTDTLPATLTVGATGQLGSGTLYDANTNAVIRSQTLMYSVVANDSSTLLLNVYWEGTSTITTYSVDASGNLKLFSIEMTDNQPTNPESGASPSVTAKITLTPSD
jgi:hypothetical protein